MSAVALAGLVAFGWQLPVQATSPDVSATGGNFTLAAWRAGELTDLTGSVGAGSGAQFSAQGNGVQTATIRKIRAQGLTVATDSSGSAAIVDSSMARLGILSAAGPGFVRLSWTPASASTTYTVTRDHKVVAKLRAGANSFVDTSVGAGRTYRYNVVPDEKTAPSSARMWSLKVTAASEARSGAVTAQVQALVGQAGVRALSVGSTTTLTYETFIRQNRIDAPTKWPTDDPICTYGKGYQFAGDNRGFDWTNSRHRTALNSVITWSTKAVANYKHIGTTKVYRKSTGALVSQRTASGSETYAKKLGSGSNYVDIRMVAHARDPYCPTWTGGIDGAFSISLTQSGNYSFISGSHRQMPDHYVYIYDQGKVTDVYKRQAQNVLCLFGAAACDLARFYGYGSF